jgi:hypothetical protein
MRMQIVIVGTIAVLQLTGWAEAKNPYEPGGGGYVDTKHPKVTKEYYIVRESRGDHCKIVAGDFGDPPVGTIGSTPYASKDYATAALKKLPECKGGEADQTADDKHSGRK